MSIEVFDKFLREIGVTLSGDMKDRLYQDIKRDFSLIGSMNECLDLERMLRDPTTRKAIEDYIKKALSVMKKADKDEKEKKIMPIYA